MIIENQNAPYFPAGWICGWRPTCLFDDKDLPFPFGPGKSSTEIELIVNARPNELCRQYSAIMRPFPFHVPRYGR